MLTVNLIHTCFSFLLLAWMVPAVGLPVELPSDKIQSTTIEVVTVDGNLVVLVKTKDLTILARSLTIEGTGGPSRVTASPQITTPPTLTSIERITTSPQGIEIRNYDMSMTSGY